MPMAKRYSSMIKTIHIYRTPGVTEETMIYGSLLKIDDLIKMEITVLETEGLSAYLRWQSIKAIIM